MSELSPSRRTVLKRAAAALAVGGSAAAATSYASTRPSAAVDAADEFLAADVRLERNDGRLEAVTVAPALTVEWDDFGGGLEGIDATLSAAIDGEPGFDVLFDGSVTGADAVALEGEDLSSVDGTADLTFDRRDLTAVGDAVTVEDFGGDLSPGESLTTAVELTLKVAVEGTQGETDTAFETVGFDVTVVNPEGAATAVGRANTDAE